MEHSTTRRPLKRILRSGSTRLTCKSNVGVHTPDQDDLCTQVPRLSSRALALRAHIQKYQGLRCSCWSCVTKLNQRCSPPPETLFCSRLLLASAVSVSSSVHLKPWLPQLPSKLAPRTLIPVPPASGYESSFSRVSFFALHVRNGCPTHDRHLLPPPNKPVPGSWYSR
jgi:hypothetical protein